jgi:hypothetical protein
MEDKEAEIARLTETPRRNSVSQPSTESFKVRHILLLSGK